MRRIIISISFLLFVSSCVSTRLQNVDNVVIINSGESSREEIAKLLYKIKDDNPRVVAIDLQLSTEKVHEEDAYLVGALLKCKNLIMPSLIEDYDGSDKSYVSTYGTLDIFRLNAQTGFVNALVDDELSTLDRFSIKEDVDSHIEYHFAVRTAMMYDSLRTNKFIRDNKKIVKIDYGKLRRKFEVFDLRDALNGGMPVANIADKLVLIGFMGPAIEDKFFTPPNDRKKSIDPDMYGVEILANIITQILEN